MLKLLRLMHHRLKLRGWIALALIVACMLSAPQVWSSRVVTESRAAFHLKRARAHVASREFDQARARFRAGLRLQPGNAEARRQLAAMEIGLGNWELASLEFQSLTELHPEDPDGWVGLAHLMTKNGGSLEAPELILDKAIDAAPKRADAHSMRGEIRLRLGRYHGARLDAEAAVAEAPKDAASWALLVRSTARSRGAKPGIEAANRGIAAVGRDPALLLPMASLLADLGRTREALSILEELAGASSESDRAGNEQLARALRAAVESSGPIKPSLLSELTERGLGPAPALPRRLRPDAHVDLGNVGAFTREHWPGRLAQTRQELETQLRQQNWREAERIVESAGRTYPQTVFAPFLAGILDLARAKPDEAETHFSEAMAVSPRFPTVAAALARTWSRKRGAGFAGDQLMRLAARDPQFAFARYMAARAYVEAHDPIQAEAALRRGLQLQPDSPVPYQHLTDYYFGLDRTAEALAICQQGLDRFPQALDLQIMLAQISAALGNPGEAARIYEAVLSRRPDLDLIHYKLAMLLASQDKDQSLWLLALQLAQPLQSDRPSDPLMLDTLGWVNYRAGKTGRAREFLAAAVKGAPDDPSVHFHLAAVYLEERNMDLARTELKAALDSPRPFPERLEALRLLRENAAASTPKGKARTSSAGH